MYPGSRYGIYRYTGEGVLPGGIPVYWWDVDVYTIGYLELLGSQTPPYPPRYTCILLTGTGVYLGSGPPGYGGVYSSTGPLVPYTSEIYTPLCPGKYCIPVSHL